MHTLRRRLLLAVLAVLAAIVPSVAGHPAAAAVVPWGNVLVPGSAWAGASASLGDLNVYSNGNGAQDQIGPYGLDYECVELAVRWADLAFGDPHGGWAINYAYQMWNSGPRLKVPMLQHPNGGADGPQFGDLIIFAATAAFPAGHVAVVSGTGAGYVDIVEQNANNYAPTGRSRLTIQGTSMPDRWGVPIIGWLRSVKAPNGWQGQEGAGGYTVDATGHVNPWGSAGFPSQQPLWPTAATARGVARIPNTNSGYVVDSYGWLHDFGGAPVLKPSQSWFGSDLSRGIQLTADGKGGYVLDAYGTLHEFGTASAVSTYSARWPGSDMARGFVLFADGRSGYVLDAHGGLHPFGVARTLRFVTGYTPGFDTARGLCLRKDEESGWWADAANDLHPFGGAPAVQSTADFPGQDVTRGIVCDGNHGGYTLTAWGRIREFGDAASTVTSATFDNPVAAGMSF